MIAPDIVPLQIELAVTPARPCGDTLLDIRGAVRNLGPATVDTEVWLSELLVNGEPSDSWAWAIASGYRDEREFALPPGKQIEFGRRFPASSILPEPGQYELVLQVRGNCSATVTVERL
jgi:hypothetical protein